MIGEVLSQERQVVGMFSSRVAAGQAFERLILAGFPIAQTFLIGQDGSKDIATATSPASNLGVITGTATGLKKGLILGNLLGGTSGLLLGAGLLALPGVGQVVLSSAIAFTLLSGGICTAAGGLIGGLIGLGLTSEQAKKYGQYIENGYTLLMVEGTLKQIDRARQLLKKSDVAESKDELGM